MNKILLFIALIILFFGCKTKEPEPTFITGLDPNFEWELVYKKIDKDGLVNGTMNTNDAKGVDSLIIGGLAIKSLVGIEYFVDLKYLNCGHNLLTELDLSSNINLITLICGDFPLQEVYEPNPYVLKKLVVSKNINLRALYCTGNALVTLDLQKNLNLEYLDCNRNLLTDLNISKNNKLKVLSCEINNLNKLDVTNNINLLHLHVSYNQLTNLDVSKNPNLQFLSCSSNQLINLDISKNENLIFLSCKANKIKNICVNNISNVYRLQYYNIDPTTTFSLCK